MTIQVEGKEWMDLSDVAREKVALADVLTRGDKEIEDGNGFALHVVLAEADALLQEG